MTLELLSNELLYEIFEFLDAADLFRAFYGLNYRFNSGILSTYLRAYHINFHFVLKHQLNLAPLSYIPSIIERIVSLRLSDNHEENSSQTDFFFSSGLQLNQFLHLRSLSLCYINQEETFHKIISDCIKLPYLTHLKMVKCHTKYMSSTDFSNTIWSLPSLIHCRLDMEDDFCIPTIVSLSIEHLSISCQHWWLNQTIDLIQQTPHLHRLHIPLDNSYDNSELKLPSFPLITTLNLSNVQSMDMIKIILLAVPNLIHLKIDTNFNDCDGYQWEEIIDKYLPKLNIFQFRMCIQLHGQKNTDQYVEKLFHSFHTQFWLEKHQWYIRYHHYKSRNTRTSILLYSLPYSFNNFELNIIPEPYQSTCIETNDYWLYKKVDTLRYDASLFKHHLSFIQFFNIRNLHMHLPFDPYFCKIIPTLHQLASLTVLSANENAQFDLQSLLDRAPNLYALTIRSWPAAQVPVVENTSTSLRRLDLRMDGRVGESSCFTHQECNTFIRSSLARQCEELLIKVVSGDSIIDLLNNMINLRILIVQYRNYSPLPPIIITRRNYTRCIVSQNPNTLTIE